MSKKYPLIVESYPSDYDGYEFITLISYNDQEYLTIIDNVTNKNIVAYVLDYCEQTKIDQNKLIDVVNQWFEFERQSYPVSVEFSRLGLSDITGKILRCFPIDYVTRVIGPLPEFDIQGAKKIKKRKKKDVDEENFIDNRFQ